MIGAGASHCFNEILGFERCFLVRKLYQETWGHMLTSKIGKSEFAGQSGRTGQTGPINRSAGLGNIVKMPIGLHHCLDLVETIEMHI